MKKESLKDLIKKEISTLPENCVLNISANKDVSYKNLKEHIKHEKEK